LTEDIDLETVLEGAESIIIITEKEGVVRLTFNQELDEMEVLDILALVTSEFYEIAEEGKPTEH
jgi:hypothetical protein|tara:strand:+ start:1105 stop:1296 length:192 start_codon:yes stop_codon:yes gene_type:complete